MKICLARAVILLFTANLGFAVSDNFDGKLKHQLLQLQNVLGQDSSTHHRSLANRSLQAAYSANYAGRFQVLRDSGCQGPSPVLEAYCKGTIELVGTSDPSIVCTATSRTTENGWSLLECTNTCSGTACNSVYISSALNPTAEIQFQCSGDELADVDGGFRFLEGDDASCSLANDRYYHFARLGVSCPNQAGTGREFDFEDYFFECHGGTSWPIGDAPTNEHACFSGGSCDSGPCTIEYRRVAIGASLPNFQTECVESNLPIAPAPSSARVPIEDFMFSARFHASWRLEIDGDSSSICSGNIPTVKIACSGGNIQLVEPVSESVSCIKTNDNVMECTDSNESNFINRFTGVIFDCIESVIPTSKIEYPSEEAFCSGNSNAVDIRHSVQLGVLCGRDEPGEEFEFFGDYFFECGEKNDMFSKEEGEPGFDGFRYTCSETVTFPSGSTAAGAQTIPLVSASTDPDWVYNNFDPGFCYLFEVKKDPTRAPVTAAPTKAPVAPAPVEKPTVEAPQSPPTPDVSAPSPSDPAPVQPSTVGAPKANGTEQLQPSDGGGTPVGAVIGGVFGGLAIVCIAVLVALKLRSGQRPANQKAPVQNPQDFEPYGQSPAVSGTGGNVEPQFQTDSSSPGTHVTQSSYDTYDSPSPSASTNNEVYHSASPRYRYGPPYVPNDVPPSPQLHGPASCSAPSSPSSSGYGTPYVPNNAPPSQRAHGSAPSPRGPNFLPAYKDQTRSVAPLAVESVPSSGANVSSSESPNYGNQSPRQPEVEAVPVFPAPAMDASIGTRSSGGSSRRRQLEP